MFFIVDGLTFRKRTLVQDAGNQNASGVLPEKDDMPAAFHAAQARADIITGSAQRRIIGQRLTTRLEIVKVVDRLVFAPSADVQQIGFGASREANGAPGLTLSRGNRTSLPRIKQL